MIGLDTNVLIRVLMDDGDPQVAVARAYFTRHCSADDPAFVSVVVLAETAWVLESRYRLSKPEILSVLEQLLATPHFFLAERDAVRAAVAVYAQNSLDFADALIAELNRRAGCSATVTFDRKAARLDGFALLR